MSDFLIGSIYSSFIKYLNKLFIKLNKIVGPAPKLYLADLTLL